jgi:hypothetical protein
MQNGDVEQRQAEGVDVDPRQQFGLVEFASRASDDDTD